MESATIRSKSNYNLPIDIFWTDSKVGDMYSMSLLCQAKANFYPIIQSEVNNPLGTQIVVHEF